MATYEEEKKAYLEQLIMKAITIPSDEYEGQQAIKLSDVNLCGSDYIPTEEPYYTPEQLYSLFHINDPVVIGPVNGNNDINGDVGTGYPGKEDGVYPGGYPFSLIDTSDKNNPSNLPGTDSAGINSNPKEPNKDKVDDNIEHNKYDFNMLAIPDSANMDDIVNAIINDNNSDTLNHAIIEFATPSLQDERGVDYKLFVKPGQKLTADTIIGTVSLNGVTKPIKSIFESGTILATEDGSDFKRLYKGAGANRHIIIEDFSYAGEVNDVNTEVIDAMKAKFEAEAQINQLITDNLCESVLPWILLRRYTQYKYKWLGFIRVRDERPNGRELFGKYLEYVKNIREQYSKDIQQLGTEDNVKATNGNIKKIKTLGDTIIARRKQYIEDIIYTYKEYRNTISLSEYDPEFSDCKYLAFDHKIKEGQQETSTTIGNIDYNNYYVALLSKLDLVTGNPYAKEYYDILKEIIEIRIAREVYKLEDIAAEFNTKFNKLVNKEMKTPYNQLYSAMKQLNKTVEHSDIMSWITDKLNNKQTNEYTNFSIQQLSNMFYFCWNYKAYDIPIINNGISYTTYEKKTYDISEEFYWSESSQYPYGFANITKKSFEEIPNGSYNVGPTSGKYSINLNGITGWLYSKNDEEVVLYVPKLTDSQWEQLRQTEQVNNIYDLVKQEWNKISKFWEKIMAKFEECQLDNIIGDFTEMANSMTKYATWPTYGTLTVGYDNYDHYLFQNYEEVDSGEDDDFECGVDYDTDAPEIPTEMEAPEDQPLDFLNDNDDDVQDNEPTPRDFKYWQRYFALATVISLPFLNCGLDIPPFVMLIPLPCIFICVGAIYIQSFDLTMVFGIAIRGMYIWPIVLFVNLSNQYANIMTALIAQVKSIMSKISAKINSLAEAPITSIANGFINMLENDNRNLRNQNRQLDTIISQVKQKKVVNQNKIKKNINKIFKPNADTTQQVIDPIKSGRNKK